MEKAAIFGYIKKKRSENTGPDLMWGGIRPEKE